jgi:Tfp pilus assembly protein PilV
MEAMIASALLATSVIGVSGAILSSYAHDEQSTAQSDTINAAESLMDELTALPFTAASATDVGLMDFASYSDTTTSGQAKVATAKLAETRAPTSGSGNSGNGNSNNNQGSLVSGLATTLRGLLGGLLGSSSSSGSSGSGSSGSGSGSSSSSTTTTTTNTSTPQTVYRTASVERKDTINGLASATGDLAIVTVDAKLSTGQTIRVRRLVTSTEAASTSTARN